MFCICRVPGLFIPCIPEYRKEAHPGIKIGGMGIGAVNA